MQTLKPHKIFLLALVYALPLCASAQWQWLDKEGRKVFSDLPPPMDVPAKNIVKQPAPRPAQILVTPALDSTGAPAKAAVDAPAAAKAASTGKDKELEEKKAMADAADAARKKAEEDKAAKARAENCTRAKQSKTSLETGRPMMLINAQGERVFMDEAARKAELQRLQEIITADCAR